MSGRILLADDDRAIREALTRALSLEGYDVVQVNDGAQALAAVENDQPDAAILDVMMPNVDGLTVCRVLRAERNRLPVLMLTARTETPDRVAGLDAGADDYLPKPFDLDELLARLRALLRRAFEALRPEGQVLIADYFADNDRKFNPFGVQMGMTMLANTERGGMLTNAQVTGWLRDAGFEAARLIEPIGFNFVYVAATPPAAHRPGGSA